MKRLLITIAIVATIMTSCKQTAGKSEQNPLLAEWDTPFGIPPFDKIELKDYMPAFEQAMKMHNAEIEAIVENTDAPTWQNTILALDNAGAKLNDISNCFFLIAAADTNDDMLKIEEKISPELSAHSDAIMLNDKLFARIKSVYENRGSMGLDSLQQRLLDKTYKAFVRSGANLSEADKERMAALNKELSLATFKYSSHLLADNAAFEMYLTDKELGGLPQSVRNSASAAAQERGRQGKYLFTISKPSMLPFLTYSTERELRKKLYSGYLEKCNHDDDNDNKQTINDIVRLRTERAHILGYKSHAAYVLDNQMAKTPENVYALLDEIWEPALNTAKEDLEAMKQIKLRETGSDEFASWDWWYYAEKLRKQRYNLDEQALRPYFSLDNVRMGVFALCNRLYGISFSPLRVPLYNKECSAYQVLDSDGSTLGVVIFDFFPREGKSSGAWCGEYIEQSIKDGKRVPPVVTIVANFTRPAGSTPALLSIDETETFFHEFGHALHGLFAQVPYKGLMGVERDFVELPSQIMENWATEPEMLRSYALHYQTGNIIPEHLIKKIDDSKHFNQGFMTTELIAASLSDMDIYTIEDHKPIDINLFEVEALNRKRGLIPEIAPRYRYPYFSHIFDGGYSSGYYSYTWAEVLDKDAYRAFVETGNLFDRDTARRFRTLLSSGGTADGMDLYRAFRGHEPGRRALMEARGFVAPETEQNNEQSAQ